MTSCLALSGGCFNSERSSSEKRGASRALKERLLIAETKDRAWGARVMVLKRGLPTTKYTHTPTKKNTGARPVGDTCEGKDAASHDAAAFRGTHAHTWRLLLLQAAPPRGRPPPWGWRRRRWWRRIVVGSRRPPVGVTTGAGRPRRSTSGRAG